MARLDLGKVVSEIVEVKTTIDDNCGVPSVTASLSGTQTEKVLNLDFKNLKGKQGTDGAKPVKGVDYFTEEDKKEFTNGINGSITAEGQKQLQAITSKGTEAVNAVTKVQTDIENILSNHGAEGNALSLNGKTGQQYDKEIQGVLGQYDGTFPLTKAEVNKVYLVPQTGKNYKCTKAYDGVQISAPNANFEDLSVLENSNRLSNLFKYTLVEEKISKLEEHKIDVGQLGHAIFESSNYQNLADGFYKIVSQRSYDGAFINYVDFQFENKKILKSFNLTFWSYISGEIIVNLNKQAIAISAHSSAFHNTLKVRLYRVE